MKNKALLIGFIIIFSIFLYSICFNYKIYKDDIKNYNLIVDKCNNNMLSDEICNNISDDYPKVDAYTFTYRVINDSLEVIYVFPLVIILSAVWNISKEFKNGYVKSYLQRKNYKSYLKHIFKNSYKAALIIPISLIIVFIISYLITGTLDYSYILGTSYTTWDVKYLDNFNLFYIGYLLNKLFLGIFFVNLGLMFIRKNKSTIIAILEAFITFLAIEIVNEIIITKLLFTKLLHINVGFLFNIFDSYSYYMLPSEVTYLLLSVLYAVISFVIVIIYYKNKEKLIIDCEILKGGKENEN